MALYWPQARMALEYAEFERREQDYPAQTLVITMREDQADDPAFAEATRCLVTMRTLSETNRSSERAEGSEAGARDKGYYDRAAEAESRFEKLFCERQEDSPLEEGMLEDALLERLDSCGRMRVEGASEAPLVVNSFGEVVIYP